MGVILKIMGGFCWGVGWGSFEIEKVFVSIFVVVVRGGMGGRKFR